jgi:hypothetical protein
MAWERYIRRLGTWRAVLYIAIAVIALVWVMVAHAATANQSVKIVATQPHGCSIKHGK